LIIKTLQIEFRHWLEFLTIAGGSLLGSKLRSILTVVSVMIGVASVAIVSALLAGASAFVVSQVANFAPDVVRLEKAAFQDFSGDGQAFVTALAKRPDILPDDLDALRKRFETQLEMGAEVTASLPVRNAGKTLNGISIQGVTPNITQLTTLKVATGREFNGTDDELRRNVCIIGADVADGLYPTESPIGKELRIGQLPYTVIGVAEPRGSIFGSSQDGFALIPLGTFSKIFGERTRSISILARSLASAGLSVAETEEALRLGVRLSRKLDSDVGDDFSLVTAKSVQTFTSNLTGLIGVITFPLTLIALAVGGIVVMNMMLASVTERTREIGIRLAIGATRRDILTQFLFEALLLTIAGGICGVTFAFLLIELVAWITALPLFMPIGSVVTAILMSCFVGIVFGVIPARRAAKLDPIEALRSE